MTANCPRCGINLIFDCPGEIKCPDCQVKFFAEAPKDAHICRNCGTIGRPGRGDWAGFAGSAIVVLLTLIALFTLLYSFALGGLLFLVLIVFSIFRSHSMRPQCPACASREVIPLATPGGQKLTEQFHA